MTLAMLQELRPEVFDRLQKLSPEELSSLNPMTLAMLQELRPEAFASLDSTTLAQLPKPPPETGEGRGIYKWEKDQQLWVALGPNMDHWDALIRLTPTVFVPEKPRIGPTFLRWDDAQLQESGGVLIARYISPPKQTVIRKITDWSEVLYPSISRPSTGPTPSGTATA